MAGCLLLSSRMTGRVEGWKASGAAELLKRVPVALTHLVLGLLIALHTFALDDWSLCYASFTSDTVNQMAGSTGSCLHAFEGRWTLADTS